MKKMPLSKTPFGGRGGGGGPSYADDTLFSVDRSEILLGVSEGPIKGIVDNDLKNVFIGDTPVQSENGDMNFELDDVSILFCEGLPVQSPWRPVLGGSGSFQEVNISLDRQHQEIIRQVPVSYSGTYNRIDINLLIQRLVYSNEDGTDTTTLDMEVSYRIGGRSWVRLPNTSWHGKTSSGYKTQVTIHGLADAVEEGDIVELKVKRLSKASDSHYNADINWLGYDLVTPTKQTAHHDLAQVHFYANSSDQIEGVPQLSAIWDGLMVPVPTNYDPETRTYDETVPWDGSFTTAKFFTSNPVWLTRELIRNTNFGLARYNRFIRTADFSFYQHAKYCDEMVDNGRGGKQPRYTLNTVITEMQDGTDLLNHLLQSCGAVVKDDFNGVLRLYADTPTHATQLLTPEMCAENQGVIFNYQYTDVFSRPNEVRVQFINPNKDWQSDFVVVQNKEAIEKYGLVLEEFEAIGCTDSHEATRKGMMRLIAGQTETCAVSFSLNRMGSILEPFQVVLLADPSRHWSESRRALTYRDKTLTVKRPIFFEETGTYQLKIATEAGIVERTTVIVSKGYTDTLILNKAIGLAVSDHFAFTIEGQNNVGLAKPFRILSCDPSDGFGGQWAVTAVEVNRNKWTGADSAEFIDIDAYSYQRPTDPPKILNLAGHIENERVDNQTKQLLKLRWENPTGHASLNHKVYLNENGGGMVLRGETTGQEFEVRGLAYGRYQVQVVTQSMFGLAESNILTIESRPSTATDWLESPQHLTISAEAAFLGSDLLVNLGATFVRDGWPVDLVANNEIGAFVMRVQTPDGAIEHRTTTRQWVYRYAEMVADFNGVPPATIHITISIADHRGGMAGAQPLVLDSEANPEITALRLNVKDTVIGAVPLWNVVGTQEPVLWYLSKTNDWNNAEFIGRSAQLDHNQAEPETDYYLWAVYEPLFGDLQVFPSQENGHKLTTLSLAEVVLPGLSGSVSLDILDKTLQDKITHVDTLDKELVEVSQTVNVAVAETLERVDQLAATAAESIVQIDKTTLDVIEINKEITDVKDHLTDIEQSVNDAKDQFDEGLADVNDKVDHAQGQVDSALGQLGELGDRVDQTSTDLGNLGQSVDNQLAATADKLGQVEGNLELAANELQQIIDTNYAEYIEFRDAILTIDPDTGDVTLEALAVLKEEMRAEFNKVGIRLNSVEASLESKASQTVVDEHGTHLTEVEQRLSAAEGILDSKASVESVEGNTTKLSEVSQSLDAVKGELAQKAEAGLVNEQGTRLAAAENTLKAHTTELESLAQQSNDLSASLDGVDQKLTAGISDLDKVVATEKEATAERFEGMNTEVNDVKTSISQLSESVNDGQTATNQQIESIKGEVAGNTSEISSLKKTVTDNESATNIVIDKIAGEVAGNKSEISSLKETVTTNEQATAQKFETVESAVGDNSAQIAQTQKTVADLDSAVSKQLSNMSSEIDGAKGQISQLGQTSADGDAALAKQINELDAKFTQGDSDLQANITEVAETSANADAALAQQISQLSSNVENDLGSLSSQITESVKTLTDKDQALAEQLGQLSAQVQQGDKTLESAINELSQVVATEDKALAQQLTELATSVGKNQAAITELNKVVSGSDSSLAEVFQGILATLDMVGETAANTSAGLDSEVQNRIQAEAEIKRGQKVLVDTTQALAQTIEEIRAEFESNGTLTDAQIKNLQTAISTQEKALAQAKTELNSAITEGDTAVEGQITQVAETVSTLEETLQLVKTELEGAIQEGDKTVAGSVSQVIENLNALDQSVQSIKQNLESAITEGDKALAGQIETVKQNVVDVEKSLQTVETNLSGEIAKGDQKVQGSVNQVAQNLTTLEKTTQKLIEELKGEVDSGDGLLNGLISDLKDLVVDTEKALAQVFQELNATFESVADTAANTATGLDSEVQNRTQSEAGIKRTQSALANEQKAQAEQLLMFEAAFKQGDKETQSLIKQLEQVVSNDKQALATAKRELQTQMTEGDKAVTGQVEQVAQSLSTLEKTVQTVSETLSGQITSGDSALSGQIATVKQNIVDVEKSLQTVESNLSGEIAKGDQKVQGSVNQVAQNLNELGKSLQTIKETLEGQITSGDSALSGQIATVKQNIVDVEKSLQTVESNLSGEITKGDQKVQGSVNQVAQNLNTLQQSVQSLKTTLEGKISDGDKIVTGKVTQVATQVTNLERTVSNVQTTLEGQIDDQGELLSGAIQENMELVLQGGEALLTYPNYSVGANGSHNHSIHFTDSDFPATFNAFIKFTVSGLQSGTYCNVTYRGTTHRIQSNGLHSLPAQANQSANNLHIRNYSPTTITISNLGLFSQESRSHYAQWSVKSDVNGLKGGVGFVNDGSKVVFALDVDQFVMLSRSGGLADSPFYVEGGKVYIQAAAIKDAVIADKLKVGAKLYSPYIANKEINPDIVFDGHNGEIKLGRNSNGSYRTRLQKDGKIFTDQLYASGIFVGHDNIEDGSLSLNHFSSVENSTTKWHEVKISNVVHKYTGRTLVRVSFDLKMPNRGGEAYVYIKAKRQGDNATYVKRLILTDLGTDRTSFNIPVSFGIVVGTYDYSVEINTYNANGYNETSNIAYLSLETQAIWK